MLTTINYKFKKPELTDSPPDITVINSNWDTVDTNLKDAQTKANTWNTFRTKGGNITGDLNLVKSGITSHFGYSAFTSVASCWTVKGGTITTPIGLNLAAEPGQWSALLPIKDNEMKLGNEHYRYSDIFVGNFSKSDNGYTKLPNGFIMQWGMYSSTFSNGVMKKTANFPISFPTACLGVTLNCRLLGGGDVRDVIANAYGIEKNGFSIDAKHSGFNGNWLVEFGWIAIGY